MKNPGALEAQPGSLSFGTLECLAVGHGNLVVDATLEAVAGLPGRAAGVGIERRCSDTDAETDAEAPAEAAMMTTALMGGSRRGQRSNRDGGSAGDGDDCLAEHGS